MTDLHARPAGPRLLRAPVVASVGLAGLVGLRVVGGASRVEARALSPDGRVEAVCHGWWPEPTEYEVSLRRGRQPGVSKAVAGPGEAAR